jgi:hypothetical protein
MKNRHKVAKSIYFPDNTVSKEKKYRWWCMKGGIGGEVEIIVYDKDKNIIQHIKKPMDSFVQNMKRWMCEVLNSETYPVWNFVDTGGNNRTRSLGADPASINAPTGDDNYGILVGSSDIAFDVAQYNLGSKIPNGSGTGQIGYQGVTIYQDQPNQRTWQRAFVNTSGGDITVKEIGLVAKVGYYALLARDVLSTPVTVPNYGTLVVRYTFKINP